MAVCTFFQRGECRFGDKCRNEHRDPGKFGKSSWSSGSKNNAIEYPFTVDSMSKDFKPGDDKPLWSMSSYGPAKFQPNLMFGIDESFEELRIKATLALKNNVVQDYVMYEAEKITTADQLYRNALNNIDQAYAQATQNSTTQDNMQAGTSSKGSVLAPGGGAFGTNPGTGTAFGQPSAFGAMGSANNSSAFTSGGSSAINQPTSVFGQPAQGTSVFGSQPSTSTAFGQSSLIKPATAFGASTTGTGHAFGSNSGGGFSAFAGSQPTAFGVAAANNSGGSVFGQSSNPGGTGSIFSAPASATSAFGALAPATSAFGTQAQGSTTSAFGTPAQGSTTSVFGAPAQSTTTPVFGSPALTNQQSAFGATPSSVPFGSTTSAFGAPAQGNTTSVFGSPAQTNQLSVFGATPSTNAMGDSTSPALGAPVQTSTAFGNGGRGAGVPAFGAPSAFGALAQQPSASSFGTPAASTSVFGIPPAATSAFGTNNTNAGSVFGAPSLPSQPFGQTQPSPFGGPPVTTSAFGAQSPTAFATRPSASASNKPKSGPPDFQNAPSRYKPGSNKYDALLPDNYIEMLPAHVREAFEEKKFGWGKVPEWIPPVSLR